MKCIDAIEGNVKYILRGLHATCTQNNLDDSESTLDRLVASEEAALVQEALERLGEPCKTLLLLYYWEERSMAEIALELGFANADTAKSKKYQCKKALEKMLAPYREDGHVRSKTA